VLIVTEFVAIIAAKAVLEAVIVDKLPSESSDDSLKSVTDPSGIRDELLKQNGKFSHKRAHCCPGLLK
jgi:hypothetical protein